MRWIKTKQTTAIQPPPGPSPPHQGDEQSAVSNTDVAIRDEPPEDLLEQRLVQHHGRGSDIEDREAGQHNDGPNGQRKEKSYICNKMLEIYCYCTAARALQPQNIVLTRCRR